jgi:hypothetical protein
MLTLTSKSRKVTVNRNLLSYIEDSPALSYKVN